MFFRSAFVIMDFCACVFLLVPIVQTQTALEERSKNNNDKLLLNTKRYRLWSRFYIWTIGYVYMTRVLVVFLAEVVPFDMTWISQFAEEVVSLIFVCMMGFHFQPMKHNPYFNLTEEETEIQQLVSMRAQEVEEGMVSLQPQTRNE
jgi:hypothetical protein